MLLSTLHKHCWRQFRTIIGFKAITTPVLSIQNDNAIEQVAQGNPNPKYQKIIEGFETFEATGIQPSDMTRDPNNIPARLMKALEEPIPEQVMPQLLDREYLGNTPLKAVVI